MLRHFAGPLGRICSSSFARASALASCTGSNLLLRNDHFPPPINHPTAKRSNTTSSISPLLSFSSGISSSHPRPSWASDTNSPLLTQLPTPLFPKIKGLLVDAAGTLLIPSEPAAAVYLRYAAPYMEGQPVSEGEVLRRFRNAYNSTWRESNIRYVGDGKPFWFHIVSESTGCNSREMFEQIYQYYERPEAWTVTPGAVQALHRLRAQGIKLAVVSNFDTRLRRLMDAMELSSLFDRIIVSAEIGCEKPCPLIFEEACVQLGLQPHEVVHLGDDRRNDVWGARDAGITAWLWGGDVTSFDEVAEKVLSGDRQV